MSLALSSFDLPRKGGDDEDGAAELDDRKLFDFDTKRLDHWKRFDADKALSEYPELYRNHLVIAKNIDPWREGIGSAVDLRPEYHEGLRWALKEVAAHLRQGDWLPSRVLYQSVEKDLTK